MNAIATHLIAFLTGGFTGATGHYLGEKYTDQRRRQEAQSADATEWKKLYAMMPELLQDLKMSLEKYPLIREFFVLRVNGVMVGGSRNNPRLAIYENEH